METADQENFEPIVIDVLISHFRVHNSVLDEPNSTQSDWSDSDSEYVNDLGQK